MNLNLRYLILFLLFIAVTSGYSQQLIEQNKLWSYYTSKGLSGGSNDHPLGYTTMYTYGEPQIVEGQSYHRLLSGHTFDHNGYWTDTDFLMREDSLGKVYTKEGDLPEVLIYDFSLEVNDVFYDERNNCSHILAFKDSITLNLGNRWEQFTFDNGTIWIKGIGSTAAVMPECNGGDGLICFQMGEDLNYASEVETSNQTVDFCNFVPVNVTETSPIKISIFPNPIQHSFSIQSEDEPLSGLLVVNNAVGQSIYRKTLKHTFSEEINLNDYPAGIYYLNFAGMQYKLIKVH